MSGVNGYIILVFFIAIVSILVLIYLVCYNKLKEFKEKMEKTESIIDTKLNEKLELIITLNGSIKKVTGKKDYLKDYVAINNLIITNNEKDLKLDEAVNLINDLNTDFDSLSKDNDFNKQIKSLREIDEVLISAKNIFNQNAIMSNKLIKRFPYSVVAKIAKFSIRGFYSSNKKTDDGEF